MEHNTITRNQSQTPRYIVVRSTLDSYIHSPRSHLGFSLYSPQNTAELFYTGITTLTHLVSQANQESRWFYRKIHQPTWFHRLTKNLGGFTGKSTNLSWFSQAHQEPKWFYRITHQPIQEKINKKQL